MHPIDLGLWMAQACLGPASEKGCSLRWWTRPHLQTSRKMQPHGHVAHHSRIPWCLDCCWGWPCHLMMSRPATKWATKPLHGKWRLCLRAPTLVWVPFLHDLGMLVRGMAAFFFITSAFLLAIFFFIFPSGGGTVHTGARAPAAPWWTGTWVGLAHRVVKLLFGRCQVFGHARLSFHCPQPLCLWREGPGCRLWLNEPW